MSGSNKDLPVVQIVCEPYEGGRSGVSRYIKSLCGALCANFKSRLSIEIFSNDDQFKKNFPDLKQLLRSEVGHKCTHFLSERRVWPVKGPYLITCHDLSPQINPYRYGYLRALYHKVYVNYYLRRATKVLCPSQATKDDLVKLARLEPEKVQVVRLGVDLEKFYPDNEEVFQSLATQFNIRLNKKYILIVSRVEHPGKNLLFAIKCFEELCKSQDVDLLVVGAPWMGHEVVHEAAKESTASKRIHFVPSASDEMLRKLYSQAQCLFFVGLREGFALPVIESLACGTPVVLPQLPVFLEFKEKGLSFYDPASISNTVLELKARVEGLKEHAQVDREFWSWRRVAEETLGVYIDIAKQ